MILAFCCPRCERTSRCPLDTDSRSIGCTHCGGVIEIPEETIDANRVNRCVVCRSFDLFVRKDFPQRLGVAIVAVGLIASSIAWYYYQIWIAFGILFATAGIDLFLFILMPEALVCYRCAAHYRHADTEHRHGPFDLEVHERHRQLAARTAEAAAKVKQT